MTFEVGSKVKQRWTEYDVAPKSPDTIYTVYAINPDGISWVKEPVYIIGPDASPVAEDGLLADFKMVRESFLVASEESAR
jgi:hypothetical protein